ncbi:hypothetical protein A3C20_03790 [Candidatus Kaiserbacteria bacterium RIFCSPHIGHO2_02_FULL_55_25]|uniref:Uncharacterized protein n=1 Tax=Candidatus Kaiserbacteria bacterium RIFCSPHIGHO2_02_FULL_55_25 TaxID=1798498 RepID=A0A1F6E7J9_9BACT|nr:MAG: hypothetical protein A2764_04055 [Candidatus Kaiserbacteria bacterium RIFCSPHIGHO2_01_FULL_55_79]OGG69616.1 MAG: hypothetical protein A3C20_03790 [Candidatus Kaiserbacteria bacterium RIFCSPHIGHO2_02_FULL_55_25]OGG83275.1 MAG: hypothetical protein A3A42_01705 [Candidatus Kaiserbacteria bacterium RIFCSPLOWO2_01_FULL_55_25]
MLRYAVAAIVVMMLGGLLGWYMFVNKQVATTLGNDAARGFGTSASFGSSAGSTYTNNSAGSTLPDVQAGTGNPAPRLWKVASTPVSGAGFAASSTQLYFAERSSGNVLVADPFVSSVTRLTNTLLPKVYEALFASDGSVLLRSTTDTDTISTYAGTVSTTTDEGPVPLTGTYLPQNITAVSVRSPQQLLFLVTAPTGGAAGVTANWRGSSQKPVFASTLQEWRVWWLADGRMYVAQKPSDGVMGYAFTLKGGALLSLVNAPGLSILPRTDSTALIYSSSAGGVNLFGQTSASATPVRLSVRTLAEKCVWAPGKDLIAYCAVPQVTPTKVDYMEEWYRGATHTSDAWWKVDVSSGTAQSQFTPDSGTSFDVEHPVINENGDYIAFINAADKSLWMLRITP